MAPIAKPASTSVVQCASKMIRARISPASSARVAHPRRGPARASVRGQARSRAPQPRWNLRAPPELTRRTFTLPNDAWTVVDPRATWPL